MKEVVWYLPGGASGLAAQHKAYQIREEVADWGEQYVPGINLTKHLTVYSENGLRYYSLQLDEEHATIFVLTWNNSTPGLRYEYIK